MARKHHIFPMREDDRHFVVATCDPTERRGRARGRLQHRRTWSSRWPRRRPSRRRSTPASPPSGRWNRCWEPSDGRRRGRGPLVEEMGPGAISEDDVSATPVVKLTNLIIRDAINGGGERHPHRAGPEARGGPLPRGRRAAQAHGPAHAALNRVISRIKILAKLDIADRIRPQDGKAASRSRTATTTCASRRFRPAGPRSASSGSWTPAPRSRSTTSTFPKVRARALARPAHEPEGVVVVTGPTGSGKTTTLYGALRELADGKVNIMTVEDPIEYDLPAITQTQVETKQGMTFAGALRAMLRQDPDVILVGEIRDKETAEVTAAQAAMTGHLVLATVHANDAVSAVARWPTWGCSTARSRRRCVGPWPSGSSGGLRGLRGAGPGSADPGRAASHGAPRDRARWCGPWAARSAASRAIGAGCRSSRCSSVGRASRRRSSSGRGGPR
jgi:hypothetical protein